ncbi:MAG: ABC transporter ATP-binding protein [Bacteroidia bacterium]|nr:ABC transporter ATP-binding protein [Bacteroidia bacterium]
MQALKTLNPYIWRYKSLLLWGTLWVLISNVFGVYPPQVVRAAIDMVGDLLEINKLHQGFAAAGQLRGLIFQSLLVFGGLVLIFSLLRGFFLFLTRQTLIVMSRKVEYDQRNDIYDHYQNLSLSFFRRNKTGDLMARITEDIGRVRMYLGPGIMYTLNTISMGIIVIITMLMVNPEFTIYAILPLPILSFSIYYVESIVQKRSDFIQQQLSRLTTFTQEIFSGIRVVKAYTREKETSQRFTEESEEYKERSMSLVKVNSLFFPLIMLLVGLSTVLTVWIGGQKVIAGTVSLGNVAEFIIYINMLTWPIIAIGWVTTLIQRAGASQVRINEILSQKSELDFPASGPELQRADLRFEKVSYTYAHTGIKAMDQVSFHLRPGQKLGILGPTGSGKSTLCNLIPRMLDTDSGDIILDGHNIREFPRDGLRKRIGYAPQDVFLFSDSIKSNIAFGLPDATDEAIFEAAKRAGIYENIMEFPQQFDTIVGERGVTLSGGQKQRLALARAWLGNPAIIILDDSLSAVDTRTEELILSGLRAAREANPDMSVIMVSHRISTIQDADMILVLQDGRITERGNHAELMEKGGYYASIQQKQLIEQEMGV